MTQKRPSAEGDPDVPVCESCYTILLTNTGKEMLLKVAERITLGRSSREVGTHQPSVDLGVAQAALHQYILYIYRYLVQSVRTARDNMCSLWPVGYSVCRKSFPPAKAKCVIFSGLKKKETYKLIMTCLFIKCSTLPQRAVTVIAALE